MSPQKFIREAADSMFEAAKALESGKCDSVAQSHAAEALELILSTANSKERDELRDDIELYIRQLKEEGHMHAINARTIARDLHALADDEDGDEWQRQQEERVR